MFAAFPTRSQRLGYAASLGLTLLRLALTAPFIWIGLARGPGRVAALILVAGFLSDVFDGVVARRFDAVTENLRRLDSRVDTVFYLGAAFCLWRLHPDGILSHRWLVAVVLATEVINHVFERWKFGRAASYHAWVAKAWGAALFTAMLLLFVSGNDVMLTVALWFGVASHLENFTITLMLTEPAHDVRSLVHVWRSRGPVPTVRH